MRARFWGVRGSIPTPLTNDQLKSRIAAVVQRIRCSDLDSPDTREAFLAKLPAYLFGTVGGNTTCLEILPTDGAVIIVDGGSGIRELGINLLRTGRKEKIIHLLMTHYHWDHLQGIPFFGPALQKGYKIIFYSPVIKVEEHIRGQMKSPYFPVEMSLLPCDFEFRVLKDTPLQIGATRIDWKRMKHPQGSYSYRFQNEGKVAVFATDSEITEKEFERSEENKAYFEEADLLIQDSQYTLEESINKIDWGHTSYSMAVDLAAQWKIKKLALFHHEPMYQDKKILGILHSAQWYVRHVENQNLEVILAMEGQELEV